MYCGILKLVCVYLGRVVDVDGVLESCYSVIVVCEYYGSLVVVYGMK